MSRTKPLILFFNPVRHALDAFEALRAVASPEVVASTSRSEFFADLKTKYHHAQAIYRTSASGSVSVLGPRAQPEHSAEQYADCRKV